MNNVIGSSLTEDNRYSLWHSMLTVRKIVKEPKEFNNRQEIRIYNILLHKYLRG